MLYEEINYSADISYLTNVFITEYDISKANISILFLNGVLTKQEYDYLYNAERMVRQRFVGKLQRVDSNITKILQNGIIEAKKKLFESNNIQDHEVLMIKNDAVFIINRKLLNTEFGFVRFVPKNVYTSFYRINTNIAKLEILYYYNNINKEENIEIKGISDEMLKLHEKYFLQILKDIFYAVQISGAETAMSMLKDIYDKYISLDLPVECYRMFNNKSEFHIKPTKSPTFTGYTAETINAMNCTMLDITYNLHILMELQKLLVSMTFNR